MESHIISFCMCQLHIDLTNKDILASLSIHPGSFHLEIEVSLWFLGTHICGWFSIGEWRTYIFFFITFFLPISSKINCTVFLGSTKDHFLKSCLHLCVCVESLSCVWLFETPWTVAHQAPLSVEFSQQEYWNRLLFAPPRDLPDPGIDLASPTLQAGSLPQSYWVGLFGSHICFQSSKIICGRRQRPSLEERELLTIVPLKGRLPRWLSGKESACNAGDTDSIPGWEDPLEKEMATHSSILAWRIPWREEPGRLRTVPGVTESRMQLSNWAYVER